MPTIKKINHVALVVGDIEAALGFWRDVLGIKLGHIEQVPSEKSAVAFLPVGDSEIELVQPTSGDSGIAKYLEKRGPGMHHLCLEVDDIQQVVDTLQRKGFNLIQDSPSYGEGGYKYVFINPKSAFGVLIELYELPERSPRGFPILETERLTLREFQMVDVPLVLDMYARQDMNQWLEHGPMISIEEAERKVRSRMGLFENGLGYRWAITFKDFPEKLIGSCGYFSVRIGTHTVEMGYELHPDYWQQGIMSEALTAVIDYSFGVSSLFPVHRIEALVDPGNVASIKLLTKLGFFDEGLRRGFGYWKGAYRDVILFALLSSDWEKR
jgi:methylmalonyl-CoA/ethylmalonyl-CoA epimerase